MSYSATRRNVSAWVFLVVVLSSAAFGCDSPKSKSDVGVDKDASAGNAGDGGGTPDKVVLPGGFEPSISCGALGDGCGVEQACSGRLVCSGSNCLPKVDNKKVVSCGDASCPTDAPICALGVCLTTDEMACVCANPDATAVFKPCQSLLPKDGPKCTPEDGLCDASPDSCCDGLSCMQGKDKNGRQLLGLCKKPCAEGAACAEGECCATADGIADEFCGPRSLCVKECRELDEECDGDLRPCCDGFICATSDKDAALNGCKLPCAKDSECDTGCCVLFTGRDDGICAPKDRCPTQ